MIAVIEFEKEAVVPMGPDGHMHCWRCLGGNIVVRQYVGKFRTEALQNKANTGEFYARVIGRPFKIEGEGPTMLRAVEDLKNRLKEQVNLLLESACLIPDAQS